MCDLGAAVWRLRAQIIPVSFRFKKVLFAYAPYQQWRHCTEKDAYRCPAHETVKKFLFKAPEG